MAPRGSEVARPGVLRPELLHLPGVFQVWAEIHVSHPPVRAGNVCAERGLTPMFLPPAVSCAWKGFGLRLVWFSGGLWAATPRLILLLRHVEDD